MCIYRRSSRDIRVQSRQKPCGILLETSRPSFWYAAAAFPIRHEGQVEEEAHEEAEEEAPKDEAEIQVGSFCSGVRIAPFSWPELPM
ncbi:hypothetical protein ACFX2I_035802 [Malus domestica]